MTYIRNNADAKQTFMEMHSNVAEDNKTFTKSSQHTLKDIFSSLDIVRVTPLIIIIEGIYSESICHVHIFDFDVAIRDIHSISQ